MALIFIFLNLHRTINEVQIYFVFLGSANPKALWAIWAGVAEALLQALGWSFGSWGLANVLTTERRLL